MLGGQKTFFLMQSVPQHQKGLESLQALSS